MSTPAERAQKAWKTRCENEEKEKDDPIGRAKRIHFANAMRGRTSTYGKAQEKKRKKAYAEKRKNAARTWRQAEKHHPACRCPEQCAEKGLEVPAVVEESAEEPPKKAKKK